MQLTLVAEVAAAYLTVLADETLLDMTRDTLESQNESYTLTQRLFEAGASTELALRQAETTVDTARADLAQYTRASSPGSRTRCSCCSVQPIPPASMFPPGWIAGTAVAELAAACLRTC